MRRIRCGEDGFEVSLKELSAAGGVVVEEAEEAVRPIVADVQAGGDDALLRFTQKFDGVDLRSTGFSVSQEQISAASGALDEGVREALALAEGRIRAFHQAQLPAEIVHEPAPGERLSLKPTPLRRVGLYVPGGRAAYPSTVLMNALPAQVAGVEEVVMCTPPGEGGEVPGSVLAAAHLAGVTRVFSVGGAQAVAAMAYGTETIPSVDKIVGPGNAYVAAAKRLVRSRVDVDKDAGPSEVVVVLDDVRWAEWAAADLLAQAEHDPGAMAVGVCVGREVADALYEKTKSRIEDEPRGEVVRRALDARGAIVEARSREEALEVADALAPEHLELLIEGADEAADAIRNAGAIFLGPWSPTPMGDYLAGPNHVLPTGGSARFSSPLSVFDFMKWTSRVSLDAASAQRLAEPAALLADLEGLGAHARALRLRLPPEGGG